MISPARYDFNVWRGNYGRLGAISVKILDANKVAVPLAGCVLTLTVKAQGYVMKKTSSNAGLSVDLATSIVSWEPTEAEVLKLTSGGAPTYDFHIQYADGAGQTFLAGRLVIRQAVDG